MNSVAIGANATISIDNAMALGGTGVNQLKVGIGTSSPATDFDIKQDDASGNERGIKLERQDNTDDWRMYIGAGSDLGLAFNNAQVGYFDSGDGMYHASSDFRLKENIQPLEPVLEKVMQLQPKTYNFIADSLKEKTIGFVAQEVETLFPEIVGEREDGYKALAYDEFAVIAIQAIKEQQTMIQQQQAVISDLLARVQKLEGN
jgi:hypothetical protein